MYLSTVLAADVAAVLLVVVHLLTLATELGECVDHDTRNDVAEQKPEKDEVNQIGHKPHECELFHRPADRAAHIQVHDTADD